MRENDLLKRTFDFGINVILYLRLLPETSEIKVIKYQLIKASTSIGANYEEAQAGSSKADFIHKVNIALKEARESNYWLRMLAALEGEKDELLILMKESNELKNILGSIVKNAREN